MMKPKQMKIGTAESLSKRVELRAGSTVLNMSIAKLWCLESSHYILFQECWRPKSEMGVRQRIQRKGEWMLWLMVEQG